MINEILKHYDFSDPTVEYMRHSEHMTYKVTDGEQIYLLRIHKPADKLNFLDLFLMDTEPNEQIKSETEILLHLEKRGNITTQRVKLNKNGEAITIIDDIPPVTVLRWVDGCTLDETEITETIVYKTGIMTGKMHNGLKHLALNNIIKYDDRLLSAMIGEAEAFMQKPFNEKHAKIIIDTLSFIRNYLQSKKNKFIITHSDLHKSNLIYHHDEIVPIDFSLSGYCVPEIDIISNFNWINEEKLNQVFLSGYQSVGHHEIDYNGIEVCSCMYLLSFLAFSHEGIAEAISKGRRWNERIGEWCDTQFLPLLNNDAVLKNPFRRRGIDYKVVD